MQYRGEIFDGVCDVDYGFLVVFSGGSHFPRGGHEVGVPHNGLCNAQTPGSLNLLTGTQVGDVPLRVTLWDAPPPLGDWEEIVEASFVPLPGEVEVAGGGTTLAAVFTLPQGTYRVRWNANAMDAGNANVTSLDDSPAPDSYELMLWPAEYREDEILRTTSEYAAYWHAEEARRAKALAQSAGGGTGEGSA